MKGSFLSRYLTVSNTQVYTHDYFVYQRGKEFVKVDEFFKYLGISYKRDNCWGLVKRYYKKELGIDIHKFKIELNASKKLKTFINDVSKMEDEFELIEYATALTIQKHDIIIFENCVLGAHVGVYIGNDMLLHTLKATGSIIECFSKSMWSGRVHSIYRHVSQLNASHESEELS